MAGANKLSHLAAIQAILGNQKVGRLEKAKQIVEVIRSASGYRWVGIYEVGEDEISVIAFTGKEAPGHPRFPIFEGLSGAAVRSVAPVVVGDVGADARYLTAFGSTRSEAIFLVIRNGAVVGTIDVESERVNAFEDEDLKFLKACASLLTAFYG